MIIDLHVHLAAIRPEHDCFVSPRMRGGPLFGLLARTAGLGPVDARTFDDIYAAHLMQWAETSALDAIGVLAFDGVYDSAGRLQRERTHLYVSNDYCIQVCSRSTALLPVCSINPQRADAIEELDRVVEAGAVAIKTLPNSQGFDPAATRYTRFWQRMADHKIPLLTHTSFEHTVPPINQLFGRPERLRYALEEGVTVIAAHCAGSGVAHPLHEDFGTWLAMLRRHPNLYGDVSAMTSVSRFPYIHKVLSDDLARERVILGSDFPVPTSPSVFMRQLGPARVRALSAERNPLQKNLDTLRALGLPDEALHRAATLIRQG